MPVAAGIYPESSRMTRFSMNLMIPTGSSMLNSGLVIKYSCVGPIIEKKQEQSNRHDVEFMWYSPLPMCIFNTITHKLGNKGCAACDGLLSVAPTAMYCRVHPTTSL
jgi:hypothetical protein